uniref:Uncharacterized protein n=1 Tax=Photinus pyralis TaxID=7054 RepID=A0A1Y1JSC4_PHOPY
MDAYEDEWQDSDFEDDTNTTETPIEYKPSYVLIAIDTDKSMFENYQDSEPTPFRATLHACYNIIDSIALSGQQSIKGPVGIALADNDAKKSNFVEFEEPVPDVIKLLKITKDQSEDELESNFERKGNFDLADFFLLCKNKLMNVKTEAYKKTVIYVTCDDNPLGSDHKRRFKVINESQKFASIDIKLIVVTFNPKFEGRNFYSEVLEASKSEPVEKVNSSNLKQKLSYLIRKKTNQKKVKFYPFNGDFERYMDVSVSKPTVSNRIMKNMHVTRDTQEEVKKTVKQSNADSYVCIYKKDGSGLVISKGERQILGETSVPVGYTLLCVNKSTLQPGWVLTPPYLMKKHANETQELFESIWQFCRDNDKCLVCFQKLKQASNVRFVELIPKLINNVRQFIVKILPFAPEIHYDIAKERQNDTTEVQENAMSNLIDALTIDYDVDSFQDPVESRKKAYIKSQLLEEKLEEIDEGVMPDSKIDKLIAPYIGTLALDTVPKKRERKTDYSRSRKK